MPGVGFVMIVRLLILSKDGLASKKKEKLTRSQVIKVHNVLRTVFTLKGAVSR